MNGHRRSVLQGNILIYLKENEVKTISELAEKVGTKRPSASRSIHTLKKQGLVYRNRDGWHLTDKGAQEAEFIAEEMRELAEKVRESVGIIRQQISEVASKLVSIDDIYKSAFSDLTSKFQESLNSQRYFEQFLELDKRIGSIGSLYSDLGRTMSETIRSISSPLLGVDFFQTSIKPLLDIQEESVSWIRKMGLESEMSGVGTILNQNNLLASRAIDNLLAIETSETARLVKETDYLKFEWLAMDLGEINKSYLESFKENILDLEKSLKQTSILGIAEAFVLPTTTVAFYTASARDFIDADINLAMKTTKANGSFEEIGDDTLDPVLEKLNPDFVEMRRGSWLVLSQRGPDRLRHAATSQRELIRQFLSQLVPDANLPSDDKEGPQIKTRVRVALGVSESDADFIDSVAKAVFNYYRELNKYTHHNLKHEEGLKAILRTGEGLLRFIITQAKLS
jgi:DNA-binding MarR family transcriptional regulator